MQSEDQLGFREDKMKIGHFWVDSSETEGSPFSKGLSSFSIGGADALRLLKLNRQRTLACHCSLVMGTK
jgi:hypothetical protein